MILWYSEGVVAGLARADADSLFDGRNENLAVADFIGLGSGDDRRDCGLDLIVGNDDFQFHLRQKVDDVFGPTVKFGMPLLAAEAFDFDNGEALDADILQSLFDFIELERLDDGFDLLQRSGPPWLRSCRGQTIIDRQEQFSVRKGQGGSLEIYHRRPLVVRLDATLGDLETRGAEIMTELLTAAQMRAIEQDAISSGAVTGLLLMERAGQAVVDAIVAEWPELGPSRGRAAGYLTHDQGSHRAVILCGPGNNGGDGFVVARLLKKVGWTVEVLLSGDPPKLPHDARHNHDLWCAVGTVLALEERFFQDGPLATIYVDALFGTGLSRPVSGPLADVLHHFARADSAQYRDRMVSVDIPSGLCADSGRVLTKTVDAGIPPCVQAHLTVTFDSPKCGHVLGDGPANCGRLVIADIGLQPWRESRTVATCLIGPERTFADVRPDFPFDVDDLRKTRDHKYDYGHVLVLSGGVGRGGAARMAARGALRMGAGAVTVGCPPSALIENAAQLNAVMLRRIGSASDLTAALEDSRINTLCLGPGLGTAPREAALVAAALEARKPGRRIVLDADALTILSQDAALFAKLHDGCVLTPHAGEFARLFPAIAARLDAPALTGPAYSKADAVRDAAKQAGCVLLFKGAATVIADASGQCGISAFVYDDAVPWLATAGAGDVLSGFIAGMLARGAEPLAAAEIAAWLHATCARSFGPGLIAEDLPDVLPQVLRDLGV